MAEGGDLPKPTGEQSTNPEGTAADTSVETGLKFIPERFKLSSNEDDAKKASDQRLKEITNTPPDQLLKSSQWRRDSLGSEQGGVEKPLSPEQALPVVGAVIESYLNTVKGPHAPSNTSAGEGLSWSPDDMTRLVDTLKVKGVISQQGGAKLNHDITTYRETGVFPPNNTNQPPTK